MEIVKLIGSDVLPDDQKLVIEIARVIRVGFLQQNAYHQIDTFVPIEKQEKMMETILYLNKKAKEVVKLSVPISVILKTGIFEKVIKMKYDISNEDMGGFDSLKEDIKQSYKNV